MVVCDICNGTIDENNIRGYNEYGCAICQDCYDNEDMFECSVCGSICYEHQESSEAYVCEDCYEPEDEDEDDEYSRRIFYSDKDEFNDIKLNKDSSLGVFGVEIEAILNNRRSFKKSDFPNFHTESDGSINGSNGIEFVSSKFDMKHLEKEIKQQISKINKIAKIDSSCGLHLHTYLDSFDAKKPKNLINVLLIYLKFEEELYGMVAKSRRSNSFCRKLSNDFDIEKVKRLRGLKELMSYYYGYVLRSKCSIPKKKYIGDKRYYFINLHSFFFRGTIEVRLHNGTTSYDKIKKWILINQKILQYAINNRTKTIYNLKKVDFFDKVIQDEELIKYIKQRQNKFRSW